VLLIHARVGCHSFNDGRSLPSLARGLRECDVLLTFVRVDLPFSSVA